MSKIIKRVIFETDYLKGFEVEGDSQDLFQDICYSIYLEDEEYITTGRKPSYKKAIEDFYEAITKVIVEYKDGSKVEIKDFAK